MNTIKDKPRFKNFQILLDSGCSSTIVMRTLITRLKTKEDSVMQWHMQAGNIHIDLMVKIDFTLPIFFMQNGDVELSCE